MTKNSRSIPSLDGLRAISIALVVVCHVGAGVTGRFAGVSGWFFYSWGPFGVSVFFVISGFLITNILIKELEATETISLRRFYFRRAFRIFPPFYAFLVIAFIVARLGYFRSEIRHFVIAGTYTWNYLGGGNSLLEHTWSLSLEEQFYLLWPAVLVLLGRRRGVKFALWLIVLSPFSRVLTYLLFPRYRGAIAMMLHARIDTIMFGCVIALLWNDERFLRLVQPLLRGSIAAAAALYVLVVDPLLQVRFHGAYQLPFGLTIDACCISILLVYAVRFPAGVLGRFLNTAWLRHIGVISYSLYLWQQMFTRENSVSYFPLNLLAILACAEASYWLIERPSFRLRDRLEPVLGMGREAQYSAAEGGQRSRQRVAAVE